MDHTRALNVYGTVFEFKISYNKCVRRKLIMKTIKIEFGHTINEWRDSILSEDCWDFSLDDFFNGAIEPREEVVYWLIDGRIYETNPVYY